RVEGVGLLVQADESARFDQAVSQSFPFLLRTIAPNHLVWRGEFSDLAHPRQQALVLGRCLVETGDGRCGHRVVSPDWAPQPGFATNGSSRWVFQGILHPA